MTGVQTCALPICLYEALIDGTHQALPKFYEYVDLRRRHLGLENIGMHDMYVPIVPEYDVEVSFDQAKQWVLAELAPMGDD